MHEKKKRLKILLRETLLLNNTILLDIFLPGNLSVTRRYTLRSSQFFVRHISHNNFFIKVY